jgi:predicted TIM-barrel fold metal-dependent hydrolase
MGGFIDIHCHINHGLTGEPKDNNLSKTNLDFLLAERKRLGIDKMALTTYYAVLKTDRVEQENEYMRNLVVENDSLYQWVVIDPRQKNTYLQAEKILKSNKTLGIKIHSVCQEWDFLSYTDELFNFASNHNAIVMMHPDCMEELVPIMNNFPKAKLIIAHLGSMEHIENIEKARYGNIYTDTSGSLSYLNNVVEYAVGRVGSEKILFGTDAYSVPFQLGRITYANITQEDKENILYRNAKKLFNI